MPTPTNITFFKTPADLRKWFRANAKKAEELWVGFFKKETGTAEHHLARVGRRSALRRLDRRDPQTCGRRQLHDPVHAATQGQHLELGEHSARRSADERKADAGRPGLDAYAARKENKSGIYAYEQRRDRLEEPYAGMLKKHKAAWTFFEAQPPSYRKVIGWWIVEREEGRDAARAAQEADRGLRAGAALAMTTYIALLRGINVGGNKMVAMAALRDALTDMGFTDVRTLLQSGNVVLRAAAKSPGKARNPARKGDREAARRSRLDFHVRTAAEFKAVMDANPFRAEATTDPSHLLVTFYRAPLDPAKVKAFQAAITGRELVRADGRHLYMTFPDGIGTSKAFVVMGKFLAAPGTAATGTR